MQKMKTFLAFKLSDVVFIRFINVKMPTIVGILTFVSLIKRKFYNIWALKTSPGSIDEIATKDHLLYLPVEELPFSW